MRLKKQDMGDLLGVCLDDANLYNQCRERHKALADTLKTPLNLFGWFK